MTSSPACPAHRSFGIALFTAAMLGCGWNPRDFDRPLVDNRRPPVDDRRAVSVLSWNLWRLREPHRVPRILDALRSFGRDLGSARDDGLPDVIGLQELEGDAAVDALRTALAPTHALVSCVAARRAGGEVRSAVGLALRRGRFDVERVACIPLGRVWPDHDRAAVLAVLRDRATSAQLSVVSTHLAAMPDNSPQADALRDALDRALGADASRLVVMGDFNAGPDSDTYAHLAQYPMRDPLGADRGRTHWFGGRIDHVLVGPHLGVVRALDRVLAWRRVLPPAALSLSARCRAGAHDDCPLSDHLPEGALLRVEPW